jgi:hypothetical protein
VKTRGVGRSLIKHRKKREKVLKVNTGRYRVLRGVKSSDTTDPPVLFSMDTIGTHAFLCTEILPL